MNQQLQNRRKFPRMEIQYSMYARVGKHQISLSTINLSFGGAFLKTDKKLPTGILMILVLNQDGEMIETRAKIVHSTHEGIAVTFINPPHDFTAAICRIISQQIMEDTRHAPEDYGVPGRIALLIHEEHESNVLFTSNLGKESVWVLTNDIRAYSELLTITLLEHGLFECETQVLWCTENVMALEFVNPSNEFMQAYQRIVNSFLA